MKRNFERYSRGGILLDLENQKSHYKFLLQPRKSLHINQDSKLSISLNNNNKYQKQLNRLRYEENLRLYKVLCSINGTKGTIQLMQQKAKQQQKNKRKTTLTSQFKTLQRKNQIRAGNQRIVAHIGHAKPRIGNLAQWEEHYNKVQKQKKIISRATQNVFDVQSLAADRKNELKNLFRETFDSSLNKSTKQKNNLRNKTVTKRKKKKYRYHNEQIEGLNEQQMSIYRQQGKLQDSTPKNKQLLNSPKANNDLNKIVKTFEQQKKQENI